MLGTDIDGDGVIGFNDIDEIIDDGIEEPGKKVKFAAPAPPEMISDKDPVAKPASGYRPGEVNLDYESGPVPKYNPQLAKRMNQPEVPVEETFIRNFFCHNK